MVSNVVCEVGITTQPSELQAKRNGEPAVSVVLQHFGNTSCIFWTFFPSRGVTDEQFYSLGGH